MKTKLFFVCLTLIASVGLTAYAKVNDPFAELLKRLEEFTKKFPQEKIHLHLDKPYYAIGDNIWLKAYVVDSRSSTPTSLSNVLYVELIDGNDSLRRQLKLPMQNGFTWGDFTLPDSLNEGNYRIRAYTQLMRNAGPEFFFDKTIKIGNSWANDVFAKTENAYSQEGNNEKVNTKIRFTDKNDQAYQNIDVSYTVELGARTVSRGKTTTNDQGEIAISIVNNQPNLHQSGKITAVLNLGKDKKITKVIPINSTSTTIDLQFFPEGGSLTQGLPSRVAFKASNARGTGEDVKGVIIDSEGNEISSFESTHLGMGSFFFNPTPNKQYRARATFKNGIEKTFDLPKAQASGYILSINNADAEKLAVKVLLTDDKIGNGDLNLLVQQNGNVYFGVKIPTTRNVATTSLPKSELPSGIITLTLFDSNNVPVAERLIFTDNKLDKIDLQVDALKESYNKREAMNLELTGIVNGKPVLGSFSASITNTSSVAPDLENETNILTSLLLKSDLKGYIEKPNFYFLKDDLDTRIALDHLLLTQGWRKINWKAISSGASILPAFKVETDLSISGLITTNSGKPVPNGKVSLFSSSGGFFALDTLTDANGRFNFDKLQFPDSTRFVVQARNERGKKDVQIKLDVIPSQVINPNKNNGDIEVNVNEQLSTYLKNSDEYFEQLTKRGMLNRTIQLKKVEIVGQKQENSNSANLNGAGRADAIITAKDLENFPMLSMYMSGRIAGITVRNGQAYLRQSQSPMTIVFDGIMMQDFSLDDINVIDIETIEVLKNIGNTAIYGSRGGAGVLVITTKRGGGQSTVSNYAPGIITHTPKGLSISREFYSPRYDTKTESAPDLRTTVYWKPNIVTDERGKFKLDFFNTDQLGTYRVVIEGVDLMGNIARKTFTYQVK